MSVSTGKRTRLLWWMAVSLDVVLVPLNVVGAYVNASGGRWLWAGVNIVLCIYFLLWFKLDLDNARGL